MPLFPLSKYFILEIFFFSNSFNNEFFLMEYASGDIKDHCWEMEEVKWIPANEALELLEYPTEKRVFERAIKISKG